MARLTKPLDLSDLQQKKKEDDQAFSYEITEHIGTLGHGYYGEDIEVNLISFRGYDPKLDIRKWTQDRGERKMLKGITLNEEQGRKLAELLKSHYGL